MVLVGDREIVTVDGSVNQLDRKDKSLIEFLIRKHFHVSVDDVVLKKNTVQLYQNEIELCVERNQQLKRQMSSSQDKNILIVSTSQGLDEISFMSMFLDYNIYTCLDKEDVTFPFMVTNVRKCKHRLIDYKVEHSIYSSDVITETTSQTFEEIIHTPKLNKHFTLIYVDFSTLSANDINKFNDNRQKLKYNILCIRSTSSTNPIPSLKIISNFNVKNSHFHVLSS